jgi:hypothetical protein
MSEFIEADGWSSLTHLSTVSQTARSHPRLLAVLRVSQECSTMALVDLDELGEEGLDCLWRWR